MYVYRYLLLLCIQLGVSPATGSKMVPSTCLHPLPASLQTSASQAHYYCLLHTPVLLLHTHTNQYNAVQQCTGCPISKFPLCFCSFLGFWSTYRGTSDLYSTALEICYIIATRILKIDSEIAEIIEVKVGTCDTKIIFLTLCNSKMSISK